jgi:hypothetical protein
MKTSGCEARKLHSVKKIASLHGFAKGRMNIPVFSGRIGSRPVFTASYEERPVSKNQRLQCPVFSAIQNRPS